MSKSKTEKENNKSNKSRDDYEENECDAFGVKRIPATEINDEILIVEIIDYDSGKIHCKTYEKELTLEQKEDLLKMAKMINNFSEDKIDGTGPPPPIMYG